MGYCEIFFIVKSSLVLQFDQGYGMFMFTKLLFPNKYRLNIPKSEYSRLSLSRIPRDSLKYFEISVPRHIRFAELRNK